MQQNDEERLKAEEKFIWECNYLHMTDGISENQGKNFFFKAVSSNYLKACKFLIRVGACQDIDEKNKEGIRPLHRAVKRNFVDVCRLLIEEGADINRRYGDKKTLLHYAAQNGNEEICRLLLVGKPLIDHADVNAEASGRETPLHSAAMYGHVDVCQLLLERGANINAKDKEGKTPLDFIEKRGDVALHRLLIKFFESSGQKRTVSDMGEGVLSLEEKDAKLASSFSSNRPS